MKNTHVVCIVGMAGSGKTLSGKYIVSNGRRIVISRTTRKCRYALGEMPGAPLCYHYLKKKDYEEDSKDGNVIAFTVYGNNYYWTRIDDVVVGGTIYYIIDTAGIYSMRDLVEKYNNNHENKISMSVIYIDAERSLREQRLLRDMSTPEEAESRITRDDVYIDQFNTIKNEADVVIDNNGKPENLKKALDEMLLHDNFY